MSVLSFADARHLLNRTGFGAELDAIQQLNQQDRQQAIKKLLAAPRNFRLPTPKLHDFQTLRAMRKTSADAKMAAKQQVRKELKQIKLWAIDQALQNPNALQEKMTWFWHNHFTSSLRSSMRSAELLMGQTQLIRQHALGNFADLLRAIPYDPLMLVYLDGIKNVREKPNENFARELLELFTLGEGHYSEQDIKEIARAFTGWRLHGKTGKVFLHKKSHDTGTKTVFGSSGNFNGDDIIELLLQHPRTAEWIAEKMWPVFISLTPPDKAVIQQWANAFRTSGYDISTLLQAILTSEVFWHPATRATLVKSPLDLVIGSMRAMGLAKDKLPLSALNLQLRRMGQNIYLPPNVKGWPGGRSWINDTTLPFRQQFLRNISRGMDKNHDDAGMMSSKRMQNDLRIHKLPTLASNYWEQWLLPQGATTETANKDPHLYLQALLLDPTYQLK